jgi:hypothetical protein
MAWIGDRRKHTGKSIREGSTFEKFKQAWSLNGMGRESRKSAAPETID